MPMEPGEPEPISPPPTTSRPKLPETSNSVNRREGNKPEKPSSTPIDPAEIIRRIDRREIARVQDKLVHLTAGRQKSSDGKPTTLPDVYQSIEQNTTLEDGEIMKKNASVAIVGGSLVGPITELLLRKAGFTNITTYEAAPKSSSRGGGLIGIEESAYPVLLEAGIPLSEIDALQTSDINIYNMTSQGVNGLDNHFKYNGTNTTWDLFHAAVARRVAIKYGKRVVDLSSNGKQAVLSFKDGTKKGADLVIFADGRGSVGRSLLDSERPLDYQGYVVWRGLSKPPTQQPNCFARYCDKSTGVLVAMSSPIRQGQNTGLSDWSLYENMPPETFRELVGDAPQQRQYIFPHQVTADMRTHFDDYAQKHLPPFLADTMRRTPDISLVPINDMSPPQQAIWRKGKAGAVLLGDALMSVRPHTGRGLNNGLEQALDLVHQLSSTPIGKAFNTWEREATTHLPQWIALGKQLGADFGLGNLIKA